MRTNMRISIALAVCIGTVGVVAAKNFELASPNGSLKIEIDHSSAKGVVYYAVSCNGSRIIDESPLGIETEETDFSAGLRMTGSARSKIDETYTLPVGKVSEYTNRANQLKLSFEKEGRQLDIVFRAYDDGVAFRYALPGKGEVKIVGESTGFRMTGNPVYWGQGHPNRYGYEDRLARIEGPSFSLALLCEYDSPRRWVLLAQAATYSDYCLPWLEEKDGVLSIRFPLDQKKPVSTDLPFESPWRVAVVSPGDLGVIVEQTLFENLNPPTDPALRGADWIQPGSASWDWFAGDKRNTHGWVDFVAEIGWDYHLLDDGWQGYVGDIPELVEYAKKKGVGIMVWKATGRVRTPKAMHSTFEKYSDYGFKGAKIDFFDRLGRSPADYEDTQMAMRVRDNLCRIAAEYKLQLVFHGAALPTGERRRWPHLLSTEAVKGQEGGPKAPHDNCIPYIRNPLGPVDYSPVWFDKGGKTDAYQLSTSVIFESGILLFADLHKDYLKHPTKSFLKHVPAAWDDTVFVEGYPASHTVIARRKGEDWYVGGMTVEKKNCSLPFDFLKKGEEYTATVIKDKEKGRDVEIETLRLTSTDVLEIPMQNKGGFVVHLTPAE